MQQFDSFARGPLIARDDELALIAARLDDPACRLVTLVGLGGIGKTRLALEAGRRAAIGFADGSFLVEIPEGRPDSTIVAATADALQIALHEQSEPHAQVLRALRSRQALIVFDGIESAAAIDWLHAILTAAPGVKILATAREPLRSQSEWNLTVSGLPYPTHDDMTDVHDPRAFGAIALFEAAARQGRASFSLAAELSGVLRICRLVDGHPLALELAASWARTLSSDEIADLIERHPHLLTARLRGLPVRQQRLQSILDGTWARLSPNERGLLSQLAVFRGGAPLWAIEALGDDSFETLHALTARALVNRSPSGRFDLHALVRGHVVARLGEAPDRRRAVEDTHARIVLGRLAELAAALQDARQAATLVALEPERDNLRAAWRQATSIKAVDLLAATLDPLWFFLDVHGWYRDGEHLFAETLAALEANAPPKVPRDESVLRAQLLARLGSMAYSLNQPELAAARLEISLAQLAALGADDEQAFAWQKLGETRYRLGRADCEAALQHALDRYERRADTSGMAVVLVWLAYAALQRGRIEAAHARARRALDLYRAVGGPLGLTFSYQVLAAVEAARGDGESARRYAEQMLRPADSTGSPWGRAMARSDLAGVLITVGEYRPAVQLIRESLELSLEHSLIPFVMAALLELAQFWRAVGHTDRAVEWLAFIRYHPMGWDTADVAREILDDIVPDPLAGPHADAVARGRSWDLELRVEALLSGWAGEVEAALTGPGLGATALNGEHLTAREAEILRRLAAGDSNRDIAARLVVTLGTVKWYLNQIYSKLGVRSRTQAVARARDHGLLP